MGFERLLAYLQPVGLAILGLKFQPESDIRAASIGALDRDGAPVEYRTAGDLLVGGEADVAVEQPSPDESEDGKRNDDQQPVHHELLTRKILGKQERHQHEAEYDRRHVRDHELETGTCRLAAIDAWRRRWTVHTLPLVVKRTDARHAESWTSFVMRIVNYLYSNNFALTTSWFYSWKPASGFGWLLG